MSTEAIIWMVLVQGSITLFTIYLFIKIYSKRSHRENDETTGGNKD
jgi:hypothetical protein